MVGTDLLHYHIDAHLGTGGMGEVYRARDTKLGRDVALKFLPEFVALDADRVARFEREARLLASLNHPSIAALYAWEHDGSRHFLAMELVEGETLADRIRRGPIPVTEALTLAKSICEALEAAHEKGVIHRDLKPANIKITPAGQVKVLDFGLAKVLEPPSVEPANATHSPTLSLAATRAGVILGTAAYMAPEQAKGAATDQRADVFALGCVLFEMISGRQPFQGDSVPEILASVIKSDPEYTWLPSGFNPRLGELIRRCLAKDPKQRWHAVADVRMEIEAVLAEPRSVTFAGPSSVARAPLWRRAVPFAATAVAAAALASGLAFYARPSTSVEVTRFSITLPADQQFTNTGRNVLALSPDGRTLVYVANRQLYLRRMGEIESYPISGTEILQGVTSPFFSPDGLWIGFWGAGKLLKVAITGGTAVPIADVENPWGVSWQADDFILVGQGPRGVVRVSANGGQPDTVVAMSGGESAQGPQMLPDGDHLLFTVTDAARVISGAVTINPWDRARIVIQSLRSGERKVLVEGGSAAHYLPSGHLVFTVGANLYTMPFDTDSLSTKGGRIPVADNVSRAVASGGAHLALSNTGSMAYVVGGVDASLRSLAFVDRKGAITPLPMTEDETYANPRVSPDGRQLVLERANPDGTEVQLWIYDLSGSISPRQFTYGTGSMNTSPEWTRDGKRILFLRRDPDGTTDTVFSQPVDGSAAEPFTEAQIPGMNSSVISLSPDEKSLLVRVGPSGQTASIWLLPVDPSSKPRPIIEGPGNKVRPRFSPNGEWIAYQSNESGRDEVWVQQFPKGAKRRITDGLSVSPDWSPDGRELFYLSSGGNNGLRLMSVEVRTDSGFDVLPPRTVVEGVLQAGSQQPYSVNPRDGRIVVLRRADVDARVEAPEIRVTLNWFEELKRLVPVE